MKRLQGFILGVIITALLLGSVPVFAENISVLFNNINIMLNGEKIASAGDSYKLDNGSTVPFSILYKGTTYLPMRKVAELLGKEVTWDGTTNTAGISDKGLIKPPTTSTQETLSQQQAIKSAESYLKYSAFSRSGLIRQLEYEKFSNADAIYAVDKLNVDWKEQAVKSAESYLKYSAFSRSGLIRQLEYEGFSNADATYAVDKLNVDWKEQAVKSAESYLKYSAFSRSSLIGQLEYEGFSNTEATYAVDQIGLY